LSTFVTIGNSRQAFSRLIDAVATEARNLPQPVIVQHGHTPWRGDGGCQAQAFMDPSEFNRLMEQSELLILHAGVSVIQAIRAGKVPVVMPRRPEDDEIIDHHQVELAQALANAGKVVLLDDPGNLSRAANEALARQRSGQQVITEPPLIGVIDELLRRCTTGQSR